MIDEMTGLIVGGLAGLLVVRWLFNPFASKGTTPYERSGWGRLLSWAVVGLGCWLIWFGIQ